MRIMGMSFPNQWLVTTYVSAYTNKSKHLYFKLIVGYQIIT